MSVHAQTAAVNVAPLAVKAKNVAVGITKDYLVPTAITLTAYYATRYAVEQLVQRYGK